MRTGTLNVATASLPLTLQRILDNTDALCGTFLKKDAVLDSLGERLSNIERHLEHGNGESRLLDVEMKLDMLLSQVSKILSMFSEPSTPPYIIPGDPY
jgi:hypothetical protein